jgi:large subunit ribosomal protein L1
MHRSRKYIEKRKALGETRKPLDPASAIMLLKGLARDWESIDLDVRLGINTRKPDQNVRGTTILPKGTGKTPRVVVLCKDDKAAEAKEAGADYIGLEDLIEKISGGWLDFDMVLATPDVMKQVSKVAKILGPRGMMPNPKSGTVAVDLRLAINECKSGKVEYRADKTGIIHSTVGRATFSADDLRENVDHIMGVIVKARPATVRGQYVKSIHLSATQSPSVRVDPASFTG